MLAKFRLFCVIECILIVFKKYLKVVDIICSCDFFLGLGGVLFYLYSGNPLIVIHYFICHMCWAVMFAFVYPTEGYTDIFCFDTNLSHSFVILLLSMTGFTILLAIFFTFFGYTFFQPLFVGHADILFVSTVLLIVWIFIISYGRKVNSEQALVEKQNLIDSNLLNDKLLAKVHHSVKNNLQLIVSFLNLKKKQTTDEKTIEILDDINSHIMAMSLVHSNLLGDHDFGKVNLKQYIDDLLKSFFKIYKNDNIIYEIDIDDIDINLDTILPLALIINEFLTNSFKYAFPYGKDKIYVTIKDDTEYRNFLLGDNGVGCSDEELNNASGVGHTIMQALLSQLDAEYEWIHDNGLILSFKFLKK
ncbi:MAG: sensor histidine kinase [archaeon]|nr:sensor histidine kinase [archaeon]